ncbi:MAG: hypothetical protein MUF35_00820 [Candidatus Nanopelagicales bacterium]|jgi:hypothetical protein|nr:hypothetical protein [Candidatus Nanopelagicales bacterium]
MTLTLAAVATLGQLRYSAQILSVRAHLGLLPGVNRAEVAIATGVRVDATPGTDASVSLDGGDGEATVVTGTVARVHRHPHATVVTVTDAGAALAALRPTGTYHGLPIAQVIGELASAAGVDTGLLAVLGQVADWVPQPGRTAADHVGELARLAGGVAHVDAGGRLVAAPWPVGVPDAAMRLDREFLALAIHDLDPGVEEVPVGAGGAGSALAPDAWLPATDPVSTGADPDATHRWRATPVLRTLADVRIATDAATSRRASASRRLAATCWPQPARRPGDVVQIQAGDDTQAGPWLLTRVRHAVDPVTATTVLHGVAVGSAPGGLLAAASGAVGGLL